MDEHYIDNFGNKRIINFNDIRQMAIGNRLISLIKEYRSITGYGLKNSKDAIESVPMNADSMEMLFREITKLDKPSPYTKEEFMQLIENAIDNMESLYYDDMLEAIEATISNIKKRGGLDELAKERDKFLRGI